jgi:hypothetical protein
MDMTRFARATLAYPAGPSLMALIAALAPLQTAHAQAPCDRACLVKATDAYLAALAAHDPARAPLAANVRFVENVKRAKVGEGLWKSTTKGPTSFSIHVPDPVVHSAGWLGMMEQDGKPVMVGIRLKFSGDRIVEVEHRITGVRDNVRERLQTPRPGLVSQVPAAQRLPRDTLARIGASYYDALDDNDGTKMPFAADCARHENGMVTAGEGASGGPASKDIPPVASDCAGQLSSGIMEYITPIDDRHVFAADPVTGLAMGFSILRHPMDFAPYPVKSLDGTVTLFAKERFNYKPFDNLAAHVWKVGADGKVHEIEAMGFQMPYPAPTGWEGDPAHY